VGCYRKSQAQVHARRVALDGRVNEFFNFRKSHDFIKTGFDFLFMHAENSSVKEDVLASGQFRVKAGTHFQQRTDATAQFAISFSWISHAREYLKQGALAGAVASNDAQGLPAFDLKVDVPQSPDVICIIGWMPFAAQGAADALRLSGDQIAQGVGALLGSADLIAFANATNQDG